jgi:hypothetical protein
MSGSKKCQQCAELVQMDARICRFCNFDFVTKSPAKPPKNSFQSCLGFIGIALAVIILLLAALLSV